MGETIGQKCGSTFKNRERGDAKEAFVVENNSYSEFRFLFHKVLEHPVSKSEPDLEGKCLSWRQIFCLSSFCS